MNPLTFIVLTVVATPLTLLAVVFFYDRWMHEGVSFFTRRRVLRLGTAAPARILSVEMLTKTIAGASGFASASSIVYEVLPPGASPFRAKGIEVMTVAEETANLGAARNVTVQVKFDPQSHLVVLVRTNTKKSKRDSEAARREAQDALLRGEPPG